MNTSDDVDSKIRDLKDMWERTSRPRTCPKCGQSLQCYYFEGKATWTCPQCGKQITPGLNEFARMPIGKKIGKYFVHGIAYWLISLALTFVWFFAAVFLVLSGFIIGLIIALILLIFVVGAINTFVSGLVWGFPMKTSATSIFAHGLALSIVLVAVGLLTIVPVYLLLGDLIYVVVLDIALCFVYGFVGEKVAEHWIEDT